MALERWKKWKTPAAAGALSLLIGCVNESDEKAGKEEPQAFTVTIQNVSGMLGNHASGSFGSAPAAPGNEYSFEFSAPADGKLSLATMFVQSNDWFYAPDESGIALFDASGNPVTGDITGQLHLWDAGTEADEAVGSGPNQAPRQAGPDTGPADPNTSVRMVEEYPVGAAGSAPAGPGSMYTTDFTAPQGAKLSFATMFVQSNDWFYAPKAEGIPLYNEAGEPVSGDITDQLHLWDAGTETDEVVGSGENQAPRQAGPNTGPADPDTSVRMVTDTTWTNPGKVLTASIESMGNGAFKLKIMVKDDAATPLAPVAYQVHDGNHALFTPGMAASAGLESLAEDGMPPTLVSELKPQNYANPAGNIQVMLESTGENMFRATIKVLSSAITPLAPGAWVVHSGNSPLFTSGSPASPGLEDLAEDGMPQVLTDNLQQNSGVTTPLAPGVWVVTTENSPLYTIGEADKAEGLEALAEDGMPSNLHASMEANGLETAAFGSAPAGPGEGYTFEIMAKPGDKLHFATMFVQSNDLFYGPDGNGIALFDGESPISGDVTSSVILWDAGTEVNETPGTGPNQPPRQSGPDTGTDESQPVAEVNDMYSYPEVSEVVKVTVTPK